jgi:glucosamine-6-phosphate deaminase
MHTIVAPDPRELVRLSTRHAAETLRKALGRRSVARLVAATGSSQIAFLQALVEQPDVDWRRLEVFHLDEYIGIGTDHPASFRRFIEDRLVRPAGIERAHLLSGLEDPTKVIAEVGRALASAPVDLLICGVGENGHLAFNDPPADFETREPYIVVTLDEPCRRQQVSEGWFSSLAEVPKTAISMSIRQILTADEIICFVTGSRKAAAVANCFGREISPDAPASILRTHPNATLYLDEAAAGSLGATDGPTSPAS